MSQMTSDAVDALRASWDVEWLRASSGPAAGRSAMLDRYATLHARSLFHGRAAEAVASAGRADLADLLDVDDPLGRALTARIVRRILPSESPLGSVVPVLAGLGQRTVRVERSRPDWHLNGTVRGVARPSGVDRLAVFAVDEGDNDVLALVRPGTPRVDVAQSASRSEVVDIHFDDVALPSVTHCPGGPALLADGLTVLAMADVLAATERLIARSAAGNERNDLALCRASLKAAAVSLTSASSIRRQHDVSAAVVLLLPTCRRLADAASDQDDPEGAELVRRIRHHATGLPGWHRDRLVALV